MLDWATVRAHVATRFSVAASSEDALQLRWNISRADGTVVEQAERLSAARAFGVPHVLIVCPVVAEAALPATDALRHNATLAIGALALTPDGYVMRASLPLDGLAFPALDRALELVAHEAARIRDHVTQARDSQP